METRSGHPGSHVDRLRSRRRSVVPHHHPPAVDLANVVKSHNTRLLQSGKEIQPVEVFESAATSEKKGQAKIAIAEYIKTMIGENLRHHYEPHKATNAFSPVQETSDTNPLYQLTRVYVFEDENPNKQQPTSRHFLALFGRVQRPAEGRLRFDPETIDTWLQEAYVVIMDPHEPKETFASLSFKEVGGERLLNFTGASGKPEDFAELNVTRGLLEQMHAKPHFAHPYSPQFVA